MAKSTTVLLLTLALIASNLAWLVVFNRQSGAAAQAQMKSLRADRVYDDVVLPLVAVTTAAKSNATREELLAAAKGATRTTQGFCVGDPGVVQVRGVGLKFDDDGRFIGATTAICAP